jgi:hypothetical protein
MEVWEVAANIATVITSLSLIVVVIQLLREMKSQSIQSFYYLHQYLSQEEFRKARVVVRTKLYKLDYSKWDNQDKMYANAVCSSYDQAGILIESKVLNTKMMKIFLKSSWGNSVIDQYQVLKPFLADFQTSNKSGFDFFVHFTKLYNEALKYEKGHND